jgi:alpha-galactosidase
VTGPSQPVGYGSPRCIGPELGFGLVVGDRYPEQVLLIKTAWGG